MLITPTPEQFKESERLARRVALVFYKETDDSILLQNEISQGMVRQLADMILNWIPLPALLAKRDECDQLRAERDELRQSLSDTANQLSAERVTNCLSDEKIAKLRTHNAALLAVARAAKAYTDSDPRELSPDIYSNMCNALSALEPLGIKV